MSTYELSTAEQEVLSEACRTLDEIDLLRLALADHDLIVRGSAGQPRPHPLVGELRSHRLALSKLLSALDLPDGDAKTLPSSQQLRARKAAESRWARTAAIRATRRSHGTAAG